MEFLPIVFFLISMFFFFWGMYWTATSEKFSFLNTPNLLALVFFVATVVAIVHDRAKYRQNCIDRGGVLLKEHTGYGSCVDPRILK